MNEFTQKTAYSELAKKYYPEALESLVNFIKINSVNDESTVSDDKPFGQGVRDALDYVGNLAIKLGFNVDWCDHYCTEISYGEGELIDIYAHADVVPVSKDWIHEPFGAQIEGDYMYGRGTSDDKGPAIAALYALKLLKDEGKLEGFKVRMVVGGNEELGSRCLEHYFNVMHKPYPKYGFTPDGDFPLIYAEKAICTYTHTFEIPGLANPFEWGDALNIVLADASITLDDISTEKLEQARYIYLENYPQANIKIEGHTVTFKGKASHGSLPWFGSNAGLHLLNYIARLRHIPELRSLFHLYHHGDGKRFGGDYKSDNFTDSSYCIGKIKYDGEKLTFYVNMRLPETINPQDACDNVAEKMGGEVKLLSSSEALVIDPESDMVRVLMDAYQKETHDYTSKPLAIGGGTYAKESKNTLAFGSAFPGRDNRIHDNEEYISLDDFYNSIAIYAHGIVNLAKLVKKA